MTDQMADRAKDKVPSDGHIERKPWSKPVLTVRSIEDVTHGTRASTNTDATGKLDNS